MKSSRLVAAVSVHLFLALLIVGDAARANETYPSKPVRAIVPFSAGGGVDIAARLVGQKLAERWGQRLVVDNRPGANGNIGAEIAARSAPDGYTLLFGSAGTLAINPSLYAKLPFDPIKDFIPVVMVTPTFYVVVTHPSVPANNVRELIKLGKGSGSRLILASGGVGSPVHLAGELLKTMAGIDFLHVPYKGIAPALAAVVSGEANFTFADPVAAMAHVASGRLKLIAAATPQRLPSLPNTPTVAESGLPGYDALSWTGIFAPAGTPRAIVDRINSDVRSVIGMPDIQQKLGSDGRDFGENSPEFAAAFLKKEIEKWGKVIQASGARAE